MDIDDTFNFCYFYEYDNLIFIITIFHIKVSTYIINMYSIFKQVKRGQICYKLLNTFKDLNSKFSYMTNLF